MAYASLQAREITIEFAREILKDLLGQAEKTITIDEIKREVAAYFGIKVADLVSKRRTQNLVYPRQIAMHICRQLTSSSLPVIGKMFGGRDHSTVIHSLKLVEREDEDQRRGAEHRSRRSSGGSRGEPFPQLSLWIAPAPRVDCAAAPPRGKSPGRVHRKAAAPSARTGRGNSPCPTDPTAPVSTTVLFIYTERHSN